MNTNTEHKDFETANLKAQRLTKHLQTAWRKHQNTVFYGADIRLVHKKGFKFYQTCSNTRQAESSQLTHPIHRTGRPVETEQTSSSSAQEIDTRFSLRCESTNVSVELLDKDKDTRRRCRSSQNGATLWWTLVPARGDRHRLQGV